MGINKFDLPVIIVGAGIGGLAAGIALRQAGFEVRVFERAREFSEIGAGLSLWVNAITVLRQLGLGDEIAHLEMRGLTGSFYAQDGRPLSTLSMEEMGEDAPIIAVHRAGLQTVLREKLGADALQLDAEFSHFEQDETAVTAHFADGQPVRGCLLIGADGIHSRVRQLLFPHSKPVFAGYTAWRCVVSAPTPQLPGEFWGRGKRVGVVPLKDGRVYWFATRNAPEGELDRPEWRKQELLESFHDWHPQIVSLIKASADEDILRNDIYELRALSRWSEGRVTLLGDAAHAMTPNTGQGACQALEDAIVLANVVSQSASIPEALKAYQWARIPRTSMIRARSHEIGVVGQWENPLACWLRDHALKMAPSSMLIKQLKEIIMYDAGTVTVSQRR